MCRFYFVVESIIEQKYLPTLPMMGTNLSSEGFPSLMRTFFDDSSDLNTPTTLIPSTSISNSD